jgi:conjugative relaxase-like TrwC/TraI family protein
MLTIRAMSNGSGYSKKHLEQNDYYAENEKVMGNWFGHGAAMLGLEQDVLTEQFEAVRQGLHPATGEKLRQRKSADRETKEGEKQSTGRTLYDFTFSAPKSVSIMAMLGGDPRLIEAHERAVKEALTVMERWASARVRTDHQNTDRITGNLVVACYQHDSSRQLDPQLHTHCVAANMTYDEVESKWKALQASAIFERRAFLTEVYRNHLARGVQECGYEIENRPPVRGRDLGFEIKGVPQEVIQEFSQRSQQRDLAIADFTEQQGRAPSDNEIAVLVRETRPDKLIDISTQEVRESQLARLNEERARQLTALREQAERHPARPEPQRADISLQHAMDHVFERVSVAHDFDVLTEALRHGRGHVQLDELNAALKRQEISGGIIRAGNEIATRESLEREREMIQMVNQRLGRYESLGSQLDFPLPLDLTGEQRKVAEFVLNSCDRCVNIQGAAGAGKTETLGALARSLKTTRAWQGYAVAPTQSAVQELKRVGYEAMTVERLLLDTELHANLANQAIVVDEAGMISGRQMHGLLSLATRFNARLILSGDTKQIQSVEASDALRILQKESHLATIRLGEVKRQHNLDYRNAIMSLRVDPAKGLDQLDRMGAIKEVSGWERAEAVAKAYKAASGQVLVVCPTHDEIDRVTSAIRNDLEKDGELRKFQLLHRLEPLNWTAAQKRDIASFVPGQVILFHKGTKEARKHEAFTVVQQDGETLTARNERGKEIELTKKQAQCFGVFIPRQIDVAHGDRLALETNVNDGAFKFTNGELVTVAKINDNGSIKLEDGRTMPRSLQQFNHGYAVTAHKSQGKTVDEVIISGDTMNRELFYVAASRGRHRIQIFTSDKATLRESIGLSGLRQSALELLRRSTRTVERTRFAERPPTMVERIGKAIEKVWQNIPRVLFGHEFAPDRGRGREIGR